MVPVFEAKKQDTVLEARAQEGSRILSSLVMFHELGHFMLAEKPGLWPELLSVHVDTVAPLFHDCQQRYSEKFCIEFQCDVVAVISTLQEPNPIFDQTTVLRIIAFGFWAFALMSSLTKSARATAEGQREIDDEVDFTSLEKKHRDYTYQLGRDLDFCARARLVTQLCRRQAEKEGLDLFGSQGVFCLSSDLETELFKYLDLIMENDDKNAREMALLTAEAFHNHPDGMNFLYLRSKTFTGAGTAL